MSTGDLLTTTTNAFNGYVNVYPGAYYTWPTPTITISGGNVSKFEQAFMIAARLIEDGDIVVKEVADFIAMVKKIAAEL